MAAAGGVGWQDLALFLVSRTLVMKGAIGLVNCVIHFGCTGTPRREMEPEPTSA